MDNERLKYMLAQAAEQLNDLADRIGTNGRPLTQRELTMARCALLPSVNALCEGIVLNHVMGIAQDSDFIVNELRTLEVL